MRVLPMLLASCILVAGCLERGSRARGAAPVIDLNATLATAPVRVDPDDPAIWIHPTDPEQSLILGTDKVPETGALFVFGLDGHVKQIVEGLDRPNNVDVEYGLAVAGRPVDIAVVTERYQRRLRVFAIGADGSGVHDISYRGGLPVFVGEQGRNAAPMGIALYRRPGDGAIFAIVSRKSGPRRGYLWQYRLEGDEEGTVRARHVRTFGAFSGNGEIEALAVDDALGFVYYADEDGGIHKWHADPDHGDAASELAYFGTRGFEADREGIAIYARADGTGYILCTDQIEGNSEYRVFRREGSGDDPHDHSELVAIIRGGADDTDGIEATSTPLGPRFPRGLLVAMNSGPRNFLLFAFPEL